jgi:hypothetical protein
MDGWMAYWGRQAMQGARGGGGDGEAGVPARGSKKREEKGRVDEWTSGQVEWVERAEGWRR